MSRLRLLHISLWGPNVPLSTVEFGAGLTLVRGPSDTGKSFIVEAIDFMLGGKSLKEIPELNGYSTVLLGVELPTGETITLTRSVAGGAFSLYRDDVRNGPFGFPDEKLSAKHSAKSDANLSMFLLNYLNLENSQLRKNAQGGVISLSFRDLAHLCVIGETKMQSEVPPAITGQYTTKTKEISAFKLLLEAEDDSEIVAAQTPREGARAAAAKIEVIDQLLNDIEAKLIDVPAEDNLLDQLVKLNATMADHMTAVESLLAERSELAEKLRLMQQDVLKAKIELSEVGALQSRFNLLKMQYDSDLERLATIREAGVLLGFFTPGKCQFCGAEVSDQPYNNTHDVHGTAYEESVDAEIAKTRALRADLTVTIDEVVRRGGDAQTTGRMAATQVDELRVQLRVLDNQLSPANSQLRELIEVKSDIERSLSLYSQVAELTQLKAGFDNGTQSDATVVSAGLSIKAVREFSAELASRLGAWGYPDAASVQYDRTEHDIVADDQFRSAHGKGVRAILHAAFTVGLAQYCLDRDIAHPGFIVLDSPLVTYRPPGRNSPVQLDQSLPAGIAAAFYRDIQASFDGQVIGLFAVEGVGG